MPIRTTFSSLSLIHKGLLLITVPLVMQLLFLWGTAVMQRANADMENRSQHSFQVLARTQRVLAELAIAEASAASVVITQDPAWMTRYENIVAEIPRGVDDLSELVADDPAQSERVHRLAEMTNDFLAWHAAKVRLTRDGHADQAAERAKTLGGMERMDEIRAQTDEILSAEKESKQQYLADLDRLQRHQQRMLQVGMLVSLLMSIAIATTFSQNIGGRLAALAQRVRHLAAGNQEAPPVSGRDEIAVVDRFVRQVAADLYSAKEDLASQTGILLGVLDSMSEAVIVTATDGQVVLKNRVAQRLFGSQSGACQDCKTNGVVSDLPSAPIYQDAVRRVLAGEEVKDLEVVQKHAEAVTWITLTGRQMRNSAGRTCGAVIVGHDVTARRRSEDQLRALVEFAPDAMVIADAEGAITRVNAQAETMFGYTRTELMGRPIELLMPQRYRDRHVAHRATYSATPGTRTMGASLDLLGLRKDGTEFPIEIALAPLNTKSGLLISSAIRDITERKRAEDAVRRAKSDLERRVIERTTAISEINRELSHRNEENEAFVYSVSHDLRSPLVNLLGFSKELDTVCQEIKQTLRASNLPAATTARLGVLLDDQAPEAIRYIQTAVTRMSAIIDGLLRLSRAGRVNYQSVPVDVNATVTRVVDALASTVKEYSAAIEVADLPEVWGDETAIELIFANLISNAIKYSDPNRAPRIEIGCVGDHSLALEGATEHCTIFVKDNGLGIPPQCQDKVFRVFQRLHPRAASGEGVGLAMLHRIVARHHGRVWFESVEGVGTTFFVELQAAPAMAALR